MRGQSQTVEEAREVIREIRAELDASDIRPEITKSYIDWGPKQRGQGKRSGHTVKGGMSAAPSGLKTYYGLDMSKYKDEDLSWGKYETYRLVKYYRARELGCNPIESRLYALTE